jgi:acetyl esterase/lipase
MAAFVLKHRLDFNEALQDAQRSVSFVRAHAEEFKNTPPFFLVHALNDTVVPAQQSVNFFSALWQAGVPVELHLYETGKHGFALETDRGVVISWANLLLDWLRVRKVLQDR